MSDDAWPPIQDCLPEAEMAPLRVDQLPEWTGPREREVPWGQHDTAGALAGPNTEVLELTTEWPASLQSRCRLIVPLPPC